MLTSSRVRPLLVLTLLGLAVRVAFVFAEPETHPIADETMWVIWGTQVLPSPEVAFSPLRFRLIFHPPIYPYFLGTGFVLFGSLTAIKLVQSVVGALLVLAVGRLGTLAFGPGPGLVAAGIAAFYPELVWFSAHFWAELLFLTLVFWAFERLAAADSRESTGMAVAAGVLWGLAILTRETVLYFAPLAALFLAWKRPQGARRAAGFLLATALVVAPWTYRNWRLYGAFVPVSTAGALNLWQGNTTLSRQEVYEEYWAVRGRIAKYEFARRKGLEAIAERQPTWFFEKLRDEMPRFWEADSQALVHMRRGAYGGEPSFASAVAATVAILVPFLVVLTLAVAGIALLPRRPLPLLLVGYAVYYNLIHVVTHGYARYRLPILPVLFLLVGVAVARAPDPEAWPAPWARRLVAYACALVLALSLVPSIRLMLGKGALVSESARFGLAPSPELGAAPADEAPDR